MKPDTFRGYPVERGIRRFYINFSASPLLPFIKTRLNKNIRQERIVDLNQKARSDDCAILLADLASECVKVLFLGSVILVDAYA